MARDLGSRCLERFGAGPTDVKRCLNYRAFPSQGEREMGHPLTPFGAHAGIVQSRDEVGLLERVDLFHEERFEAEPLVTRLDRVIVSTEEIDDIIPMDKGELTLILCPLREVLLVGLEFLFESHLVSHPYLTYRRHPAARVGFLQICTS